MNREIQHKIGATFQLAFQKLFDGEPDDADYSVSATIKDRTGNVVDCATVTVVDLSNGQRKASVSDTTEWPQGSLVTDIRFETDDGTVMYTENIWIRSVAAYTHPGDC